MNQVEYRVKTNSFEALQIRGLIVYAAASSGKTWRCMFFNHPLSFDFPPNQVNAVFNQQQSNEDKQSSSCARFDY